MSNSRRSYSLEFKQTAVEQVRQPGARNIDVAQRLGISPGLLSRWKHEADRQNRHVSMGKLGEQGVRGLERELAHVKDERDVLIKALSLFAKRLPEVR